MQQTRRNYFWRSKFDKPYSFIVNQLLGGNKMRQIAVNDLELKEGDKVLDIACGAGKNFKYIINKIGKNGRLVACDYSKEILNMAQKFIKKNNWSNNIELIYRDAFKLNYKEEFDVTICTFGLTVIPEWKEVLDNIIKATRKSGKICIIDEVYIKDFWGLFNLFVWIDSKLAGADPKREILQELKIKLKDIEIKKFLFGTIFVAIANKL